MNVEDRPDGDKYDHVRWLLCRWLSCWEENDRPGVRYFESRLGDAGIDVDFLPVLFDKFDPFAPFRKDTR